MGSDKVYELGPPSRPVKSSHSQKMHEILRSQNQRPSIVPSSRMSPWVGNVRNGLPSFLAPVRPPPPSLGGKCSERPFIVPSTLKTPWVGNVRNSLPSSRAPVRTPWVENVRNVWVGNVSVLYPEFDIPILTSRFLKTVNGYSGSGLLNIKKVWYR